MIRVIYLVLDKKTGKCLYVGRTRNFELRCRTHQLSKRFKNFTLKFKVHKKVTESQARAEEKNTILRFKAIGEAEFNKACPFTFSIKDIVKKIKAMNDFIVGSDGERKFVLSVANAMGAEVITRKCRGGFRIFIPSDVTN